MRTLIKGGTVVTATETTKADVVIEDERVSAIGVGMPVQADVEIDATDRYVMPGGVDVHTHMDLPFGGSFCSDNFESGTRAAAFGGTTTIVDFALQDYGEGLREGLDRWHEKAKLATTDYGFHMIIREVNDQVLEGDGRARGRGRHLVQALHGVPGRLHARRRIDLPCDATGCRFGSADHDARRERGPDRRPRAAVPGRGQDRAAQPRSHAPGDDGGGGRPPRVQARRARRHARLHRAPVLARRAERGSRGPRSRSARVRGNLPAVPVPLAWTTSVAQGSRAPSSFARHRCAPPITRRTCGRGFGATTSRSSRPTMRRSTTWGRRIWARTTSRRSRTVSPPSRTGSRSSMEGVEAGHIGLNRFVEIVATAPAKMFGLYPRKGTIAPGSDADVVVFDPRVEREISAKTHHMYVDYSAYEGRKVRGLPEVVMQRGRVLVQDGAFHGRAGQGRFLQRSRIPA